MKEQEYFTLHEEKVKGDGHICKRKHLVLWLYTGSGSLNLGGDFCIIRCPVSKKYHIFTGRLGSYDKNIRDFSVKCPDCATNLSWKEDKYVPYYLPGARK